MVHYLTIGLFGALGAIARAGLSAWLNPAVLDRIPLGTLVANITGSFLLGLLTGLASVGRGLPEQWRTPVTTGFLGSLTTFSTFSVETLRLAESGSWRLAGLNLLLQLGLGLPAAGLGLYLGRKAGGGV